ncbi:MAG: hypothetical protein LBT92_00935 [Rickettsiales bacterium]|jgi:hypothetical protein|nr:hypothetical protein [Rickettsiales bacterium]
MRKGICHILAFLLALSASAGAATQKKAARSAGKTGGHKAKRVKKKETTTQRLVGVPNAPSEPGATATSPPVFQKYFEYPNITFYNGQSYPLQSFMTPSVVQAYQAYGSDSRGERLCFSCLTLQGTSSGGLPPETVSATAAQKACTPLKAGYSYVFVVDQNATATCGMSGTLTMEDANKSVRGQMPITFSINTAALSDPNNFDDPDKTFDQLFANFDKVRNGIKSAYENVNEKCRAAKKGVSSLKAAVSGATTLSGIGIATSALGTGASAWSTINTKKIKGGQEDLANADKAIRDALAVLDAEAVKIAEGDGRTAWKESEKYAAILEGGRWEPDDSSATEGKIKLFKSKSVDEKAQADHTINFTQAVKELEKNRNAEPLAENDIIRQSSLVTTAANNGTKLCDVDITGKTIADKDIQEVRSDLNSSVDDFRNNGTGAAEMAAGEKYDLLIKECDTAKDNASKAVGKTDSQSIRSRENFERNYGEGFDCKPDPDQSPGANVPVKKAALQKARYNLTAAGVALTPEQKSKIRCVEDAIAKLNEVQNGTGFNEKLAKLRTAEAAAKSFEDTKEDAQSARNLSFGLDMGASAAGLATTGLSAFGLGKGAEAAGDVDKAAEQVKACADASAGLTKALSDYDEYVRSLEEEEEEDFIW